MKILYYSSHHGLNLNAPAGYATHMRETIKAMEDLGHEVYTQINGGIEWHSEKKPPPTSKIKKLLKKIIPKIVWESLKDRQLRKKDNASTLNLNLLVQKVQPDLIYERYNYFQNSGAVVAKKNGIKHILEVNSPYVEERIELQGKSWYLSAARKMEADIFHASTRLIVVSSALKTHFEKEYLLDKNKVIVIPNAISKHWLKNMEVSPVTENEKHFLVGFVGSLFPWHGVDLLIKAFAEFSKDHPHTKLQIVGDGAILSELEALARNEGIQDKVDFTGSVPHNNVPGYIKNFDVAVMARSNWYGSPVKIFEYGALGVPIIAPDNIPVKDVMKSEVHGLLVAPEVKALKKALFEMYVNEIKRKEMAICFQSKVLAEHTWKENVVRTLKGL